MQRVITYVDGFNLYFGLKSKGWRRYYWLNIHQLAQNLLKPNQELVQTKYFTSRVASPPTKVKRQSTYIEALQTTEDMDVYYGKYQLNDIVCQKCGFVDKVPNEKMTDVNIATELLSDAFQNKFDTALLISADSDLTAPLDTVRKLFSNKRIVLAYPPGRYSSDLKRSADTQFTIGRAKVAQSLFPDEVVKPDGFVLSRPSSWR